MCWVKLSLMYLLIGWWSVHTKTLKLLVLNRIEAWCRIIHSRSSKAICSFLYHLHQIDILSGPNISSQSMWNYFHPFTPNDEIFVRLWKQMNRLSRVEWRHMVGFPKQRGRFWLLRHNKPMSRLGWWGENFVNVYSAMNNTLQWS